uniref:UMOD/GP2/OIT3-like D8C domain-containing protein n=1 Tax=Pygocentrus nattereri TaxID=42514 RepID=A0A3B4BPB9_PYGNA
ICLFSGTPNNLTFDPCNVSRGLDNDWRSYYYVSYLGQDDTLVEWNGWYRLYIQGKSAQIPESDWCWSNMACGGYTPLFLGGTHPQPQDGIVTREVYGTYGSVTESRKCYYYRSNPIQVKACPGNYYVYRLVKPAVSVPMPAYCAVAFDTPPHDPCNRYTSLDQPWRATNATGLDICDSNFNWNGWYRLLYYGMSVRMPESCVNVSRCGTYTTLWLTGSHPQIEDGIVTRGVCGRSGSDCCYYRFIPIRVKACPGNYYVYEFVRPTICSAAYCAGTLLLLQASGSPNNMTFDPCSVSTVLDNSWRNTGGFYYSGYRGFDDTLIEWSGWYRLYLQGKSAQIPESDWCASYMTCGGYTPLLLGGSHPRLQDGIVTREIYGSYGYVINSSQCNSYRSNSIQVKACPGNYYVYRLVKPALSFPMPTYCAVVLDSPNYDPCNIYTALDQPWRATNAPAGSNCDNSFNGNVWYRMLYNGMNIRMSDSCVNRARCGTDVALWLNGSHPQIEDGIVTHLVCGSSGSDCCYYRSIPIRVKACPGNYYVYEFVRPTLFCNALQAVYYVSTTLLSTTTVAITPELTTTPTATFNDPCTNYTALDQPWRATNATGLWICDRLFNWTGWYRLLYYGMSVRMADSCVNRSTCGTDITLWLNGSHPQTEDGIVTRGVCGRSGSDCCYYRSTPIRVKACLGNYYVYEFVRPNSCVAAYCAGTLVVIKNTDCVFLKNLAKVYVFYFNAFWILCVVTILKIIVCPWIEVPSYYIISISGQCQTQLISHWTGNYPSEHLFSMHNRKVSQIFLSKAAVNLQTEEVYICGLKSRQHITEVSLSKTPNPQLLPWCCGLGCPPVWASVLTAP